MQLETHAGPQRRLERVAVVVAGPKLHEHPAVAIRDHRRKLEEVADEDDLLPTGDALCGENHVHHAFEQVDAAHGDIVDDDDLGLIEHLAGQRLAILVMWVENAESDLQRAVDGRAVAQVLRGDTRRSHREVGHLAPLQLVDEGIEHVALTRAGITG